jgi:hypothetical protein
MINWEINDKECVYAFLEKYYNIIAVGNREQRLFVDKQIGYYN